MTREAPPYGTSTLDPTNWAEVRSQGHAMLDDMFDFIEHVRDRPVWQSMTPEVRAYFTGSLPQEAQGLKAVYEEFQTFIKPYSTGNVHPGFMGWVHGGGTVAGMLAEMLAGGLNANLGGRDHAPIAVELQIVRWLSEWFRFPSTASGLFVTGSSIANLIALWVARSKALGPRVRDEGVAVHGHLLRAYTSASAHCCIAQAMDLSGLGIGALRTIEVDDNHRMELDALSHAIREDRARGLKPFLIVATAGTVDVGATDDLNGIADLCAAEGLWLHVDGAFGAFAAFSQKHAHCVKGLDRADSLAFDFHKWGQVPYDAGFVLIRDGDAHRSTFSAPASYLTRSARGLAAGDFWPCDYGPDLSRGFRALKTWFTIKTYGSQGLSAVVDHTCGIAAYLEERINTETRLELMAPVFLNIVCFRYKCDESDLINAEIVVCLQETGLAAPSTTVINGRTVIRAAIFNHRTQKQDIDLLIEAIIRIGQLSIKALETSNSQ